jgi:predicted RNA-binding Zn-ribbon protein involved in translation (DUF1610 family)
LGRFAIFLRLPCPLGSIHQNQWRKASGVVDTNIRYRYIKVKCPSCEGSVRCERCRHRTEMKTYSLCWVNRSYEGQEARYDRQFALEGGILRLLIRLSLTS